MPIIFDDLFTTQGYQVSGEKSPALLTEALSLVLEDSLMDTRDCEKDK